MSKKVFKIGDRVRSIKGVGFTGVVGATGVVKKVDDDFRCTSQPYGVVFESGINGHNEFESNLNNSNSWWCKESDIELISNPSIHITVDGTKVIAVMKEGKQEVGRGVAACNPNDEFDFKTGAKLAMDRLLGKEIKGDFVTGVSEVRRKAKVGEWIKFKSDAGNGKLLNKIGKVLEIGKYSLRVEHEKVWEHSMEPRKGFEITKFTSNPLYVVLENYNPEKTESIKSTKATESQDDYLSFKKIKRRAEVGEYMLVVNASVVPGDDYKNGDILKCIGFEYGCSRYTKGDIDSRARVLAKEEYVVLEGYQPPKIFDVLSKEEVLKVVEKALEK